MNGKRINIWRLCKYFTLALALYFVCVQQGAAQHYPVHAAVQWPSPQSPYLSDYYTGSRERLIVTLLNRDLQQPLLYAKLRIKIKSTGFLATTREEYDYPMLELHSNVPTRLTNIDLTPYLQPDHLQMNGSLRNGQLPTGYTELAVQVIDYYTGRVLSAWHTGRAYLDVKKPPLLNFPEKDAQVGIRDPLYIRFGWTPRHQGLAGTEYEFVLKELPDNGAAPQSAFAYGNEIYRIRTRNTSVNYTHLEPILSPGRRYGWQVQAIARDGIDEVGLFENGGFSEISWFYLSDNCLAPTGLKAAARFARVDLSWNKVTGTTGYVVECRPKTKLNVYEWSNVRVTGESLTLGRLNPGWTYEWRVGTLCTEDRPVFSDVKEFTLSKYNDELLADCGKEPVRSDLSQEPNLRIKAGDVVIIGGDYPMTITEATFLGDGWYAGRGKTRLKTIIDAPVALRFDRLRINVDNFQIDGSVEASYDEQKGKIGNLDYIDDGGKDIQPSTLRIREHKLDFTLPDIPQIALNPGTGELELTDADGNPHTIKIDLPENASYESIFPMIVTDDKGNSYQLTPAEQHTDAEDNVGQQGKVPLQADRVDRVGDFSTEALSDRYGHVRFERGEGRYAFDAGTEAWYRKSVKTDRFYKPFARNYIAPWKLVPVGESDVVTARYDGRKDIDLRKVRFVSEPNATALPAQLSEAEQTWTVGLRSVAENSAYDVFAVYEGEVIGKLRVVSYAQQQHRVTLVPINGARLDRAAIEQELNAIYNPVGVQFTVDVDERMRGNYDWEAASEKDGLLGLAGTSFWGYDRELKESAEMVNLQKLYQQQAGTLSGAYLFVLNGAKGLEGRKDGLLGEMPRKNRFGYIFAGHSPDAGSMSYTIAHELGHGLFTLQHTFDSEYGGRKSEATTANLMDYAGGKELAAFQWNIMASPAVFTLLDDDEEGQIRRIEVGPHLFTLRTYRNLRKPIAIWYPNGELDQTFHLFDYKFQNRVFVSYATERMQTQNGAWILPNITFSKHSKHSEFHNATLYQIAISDEGEINCLSEKDRDMIYSYLTAQNDCPIFDPHEVSIHDQKYNFCLIYNQLERQKRDLIASGKYRQLTPEERIILDLPLIMWLKQYYYGAIFMYNWLIGGGDIEMDDAMFAFLDKWEKKVEAEQEFMQFFENQKNNAIGKEIEKDGHKIYALNDVKQYIAQSSADTIRFDSQNFSDGYLNFARCNISKSIYYDKINDEHIASFGTLSILYLFEGKYDRNSNIIAVYNLIEKIKDGFDFEDDSTSFKSKFCNFVFDGQPLGAWSNLFETNKDIGFNWLFHFDEKLNLSNATFRSFRNKTNIGKDFRIIGNRKVSRKFIEKIIIKQNSLVVYYL